MSGIEELIGNFTMVPHHIFDEDMKDMDCAELKVTLAAIRKIIGFHHYEKLEPISLSQFEEMTGMSKNSVLKGIESSIKRGFLRHVDNEGLRGTARYTLVFKGATPSKTEEVTGSETEQVDDVTSSEVEQDPVQKLNTQNIGSKDRKDSVAGRPFGVGAPGTNGKKEQEEMKDSDDPESRYLPLEEETPAATWVRMQTAGKKNLTRVQARNLTLPNQYLDYNNQMAEISIEDLFEEPGYQVFLNEQILPKLKQIKGVHKKDYHPAASTLIEFMRSASQITWYYEWKQQQTDTTLGIAQPPVMTDEVDWTKV